MKVNSLLSRKCLGKFYKEALGEINNSVFRAGFESYAVRPWAIH